MDNLEFVTLDVKKRRPSIAELEAYLIKTGWVAEGIRIAPDGEHKHKLFLRPNANHLDVGAYVPLENYPEPFHISMVIFHIAQQEKISEYEAWQRITGEFEVSSVIFDSILQDIDHMAGLIKTMIRNPKDDKEDAMNKSVIVGIESVKKIVQGFYDREKEEHQS